MSLVKLIRLGFAVPLVVSGLLGALSYRTASQIPEASRWVEHTHDVIAKLRDVSDTTVAWSTSERNWVQTGLGQRAQWEKAASAVDKNLAELCNIVRDDPAQAHRSDELREAMTRLNGFVIRAGELRESSGAAAATGLLKQPEVTKTANRVVALLRELGDRENDLLEQRHLRAKRSAQLAMILIGAGTIAAIVLGLAASVWIIQRVTRPIRQLVKAAEEIGAGSLDYQAEFTTNDELGVLARAFNEMSRRLRETTTDLRTQTEALRSQSGLLKCIVDRMADGVIAADQSGRFILFNEAAQRMLGTGAIEHRPEERSSFYGVHRADQTACPSDELPLARALRGEIVDGLELYVRNDRVPAGLWINVNGRPLLDEFGRVWGAVIVLRDVTEKRRTDEVLREAKETAENANCAKSEFLSRMSHELRTPLNSILGFGQLLEMHNPSGRELECVGHILKGGRHLLALIDEVLDISRIEAGKLSLSVEPVQLNDAISQAIDMVRPMAEKSGIVISAGGIQQDYYASADRRRLHQIFLNLLTNSVKYNRPNGTVTITCSPATDHGRIRIAFVDTGIGISAEDQERLFVPFERLGAVQSDVPGTGLGLALCKRLVEAMHGTIGVFSAVDQGTCFWVELTMTEAPGLPYSNDQIAGLTALSDHVHEHATILYVEDNLSNLRLMEHVLTHRPNVKLAVAMQGQLGVDLAIDHRPDLILLDLHLPDLTGDVVLKRLREHPRTSTVPIIIISADATPGQVNRLRELGATDYMTKPFDIQKLLKIIDDAVVNRPVQPAALVSVES